MATQCYFLAFGDRLWFLIVQHVFILCLRKKSAIKAQKAHDFNRDVDLSERKKRKSTGVFEECKVMFNRKRIQGDTSPRTLRPPPWDMTHLTQMICQ